MKKGKFETKGSAWKVSKKLIALALALVLTIGGVVGGTLAWLTSTTGDVVNTFTDSDINIKLVETKGELNPDTNNRKYKMVPGNVIEKDPKVTVEAGSEACWLFVKVNASNVATYLDYSIESGWKLVAGETDVYYRLVDAATATAGTTYSVLTGDKVTVKDTVTKADMDAIDGKNAAGEDDPSEVYPTLTFTAYAIQQAHVGEDSTKTEEQNAEAAWKTIFPPASGT